MTAFQKTLFESTHFVLFVRVKIRFTRYKNAKIHATKENEKMPLLTSNFICVHSVNDRHFCTLLFRYFNKLDTN